MWFSLVDKVQARFLWTDLYVYDEKFQIVLFKFQPHGELKHRGLPRSHDQFVYVIFITKYQLLIRLVGWMHTLFWDNPYE